MKPLVYLSTLIAINMTVVGCSNDTEKPVESNPQSTSQLPTYTLAVERTYPPFVELNDAAESDGFDIEIMKAIGEKAGFNIEVEVVPWVGAFAGLEAGKYQILGSGVGINSERQKIVDFSNSYIKSHLVFATNDPNIKSVADINGKRIAIQPATYHFKKISEKYGGNNEIMSAKSLFISCQELILGNADLCVDGVNVINHFKTSFKDNDKIKNLHTFTAIAGETKEIAFAVQKGNTELLAKINKGLAEIKDDGTYNKIHQKWLPEHKN